MPHDGMVEGLLQQFAAGLEIVKLTLGIFVLFGFVGNTQVGEHRCRGDDVLLLEQGDEFGQLFARESQAVHTAVDFNVHGEVVHAIFLAFLDKVARHVQVVEFGLQAVLEHGLVVDAVGVEHDDGHGDAGLAQVYTLVMHGDGEVVATAVLQCLGNLVTACSIAACLDHSHSLGARFDE